MSKKNTAEETAQATVPPVIIRKDTGYYTIPLPDEAKQEVEAKISLMLKQKFESETQISELKDKIKKLTEDLKDAAALLRTGKGKYIDVEIHINTAENSRKTFHEGMLIESEELDPEDLQLEIDDYLEEQNQEEEQEEEQEED